MTDETKQTPAFPATVTTDLATQPDQSHVAIRPLFKETDSRISIIIPNQRLETTDCAYWRYLMGQIRCEVRLSYQANAVRVTIILPTGTRKHFHYNYQLHLKHIVADILKFSNYVTA